MLAISKIILVVVATIPIYSNGVSSIQSGSIEGVIVDDKEIPIANASVYASNYDDVHNRIATSADSNGRFKIQGVTPGRYTVFAYSEDAGYPDLFFSFFNYYKDAWKVVNVSAGQTIKDIRLNLGSIYPALNINIQDDNGNPVSATLTFTRLDDSMHPYSRGASSMGKYLVPPVKFRLEIRAEGYIPWQYTNKSSTTIYLHSGEILSINAVLKKLK
jgi:Carboxypeptidase regulatory-like domain